MSQKLATVAAWTLLAFITYATISPIQDRPRLFTSSSLEHFAAFAFVGALFYLAYPRHILFVCLVILGSAVLLEIVQLMTPDRHGRIQDAIEKIAGGVAGVAVARVIFSFEQAKRWFQN